MIPDVNAFGPTGGMAMAGAAIGLACGLAAWLIAVGR